MEGIEGGDDRVAAFIVAEFASQFEEPFVRFRPAVTKETAARADQLDQSLGQPALRLIIVEVGNVEELAGLIDERLGDFRVGVPQGTDRDASAKIKKTPVAEVPDVAPLPPRQHQIEARVGWHDEFLKDLADLLLTWTACPDRFSGLRVFPFHKTTSVPTPASVKISSKTECGILPSTNCTFSTPLSIAVTALSTFGIMPRSITPPLFNSGTSTMRK